MRHTYIFKHVLMVLISLGITNFCFSQKDDYPVTMEAVNGSIYMLEGKGGNIAFCIGEESVLMVDAQFEDMAEKINEALSEHSDKKVSLLVNTHWHGDHTGGNAKFAEEGAKIIAHKNVRKRLTTEQHMKAFNRTVPAAPKAKWPVITFNDENMLYINEEEIFMFHVENAHTDGDAMVYFTSSNVLHMGDTYFKGKYPFIDLSSGGSIDGLIKAVEQAVFICDDDTKIIPGHGKLSNKVELKEYLKVITMVRDNVQKAIEMDMSLEEIKAAKLSKEFDETYGTGFIAPDSFIDTIWTDLTKDKK